MSVPTQYNGRGSKKVLPNILNATKIYFLIKLIKFNVFSEFVFILIPT